MRALVLVAGLVGGACGVMTTLAVLAARAVLRYGYTMAPEVTRAEAAVAASNGARDVVVNGEPEPERQPVRRGAAS